MNEVESLALETELEVSGTRGYSAYEIAKQHGFEGSEEEWLESLKGEDGGVGPEGPQGPPGITPDMRIGTVETLDPDEDAYANFIGTPAVPILNIGIPQGKTGNGIASWSKTGTSGLVDTYTITYTDGTTTTLNVTNGKSIISITKTTTSGLTDTYTILYNDNTVSTFYIQNGRGIVTIDLTSTLDNVDTYTITYNDGTTSTFNVTNSTVSNQEFEAVKADVDKYKTLSKLLPKVEGEGTTVTLNNTVEGVTMDIIPEGNTSQDGTATFDTPIPIKVVTGEQTIQIGAKDYSLTFRENENLFDKNDFQYENGYYNQSLEYKTSTLTGHTIMQIPVKSNTQYEIRGYYLLNNITQGNVSAVYYYNSNHELISRTNTITTNTYTFTTPSDCQYIDFQISIATAPIFMDKGLSTFGIYENKYYNYELSNIINKDYIYGTPNNWYKYKYVNSKEVTVYNINDSYSNLVYATIVKPNDYLGKANYGDYRVLFEKGQYQYKTGSTWDTTNYINKILPNANNDLFYFGMSLGTTKEQAETILNGTKIYYPIEPVPERILDTTLIEQLNNLYNATSQDGTTIITCSSASDDNETLQVKASTYKDISSILNPTESEGE